jgi:hypothetical protein
LSEEDDLHWLDALAGRPASGSTDAADREARTLRGLISTQIKENIVAVSKMDFARESALIARAKAEGLLPPRSRRPWFQAAAGLAAAALLASVLIGLYRTSLPPSETFRGVQDGTVRLAAKDPSALKQQIIRELHAAGIPAVGYERLGRSGVDAELPKPISAAAREVLERHHIPVPQDGALVIEIVAADPP